MLLRLSLLTCQIILRWNFTLDYISLNVNKFCVMMNKYKYNLIELDIGELFVAHKIEEILEIEHLLDGEIEKKRNELRSMVGDRYKDILIASDSIKSMKNISTYIVKSIQNISNSCNTLLINTNCPVDNSLVQPHEEKITERILVIQIRLSIYINETIWMYLDKEDYLNSVQLYLLGQNIHTGLTFIKSSYIQKVPFLKHVKLSLSTLKNIILDKIIKKLQSVELTSEQACSNLNGLMLLQNQNTDQLISIFMEHRMTALTTVINISHSSVRIQISAMVKCLITTIHLLYDCFMNSSESTSGLIFKQLEDILSESSQPTLFKVKMPVSPLDVYIPQLVREFRPKYKMPSHEQQRCPINEKLILNWLEDTKESVKLGLHKSLELVTSIKGLHIIREEALKIGLPAIWDDICDSVKLSKNFNVWQYFFQSLVTDRAKVLIGIKVKDIMDIFKKDIENELKNSSKSKVNELDLRSYIWTEDAKDIGKFNQYSGLSMKAMGFSPTIVAVCQRLDAKFFDLLCDLSQYLYDVELDEVNVDSPVFLSASIHKKKLVDLDVLQKCLVEECVSISVELLEVLKHFQEEKVGEDTVKKSVFCIRLLQAIIKLCPYFKKCCSLNNSTDDWFKICEDFNKYSNQFWMNWINHVVNKTKEACSKKFKDLTCKTTLTMFLRWDIIEIQEQTDEKVFKSQIRVPLKLSTSLEEILFILNENICCLLPHTMPKIVHVQCIENSVEVIFNCYKELISSGCNQNQALQLLFDVKFLTMFCIQRENEKLIGISQGICDKLRSNIDPFDLDVFHSYLETNVKRAAVQSMVLLGCILPSYMQIANLEISEKGKEQEKEPSILPISNPSCNSYFPLLPVTAPSHKHFGIQKETKTPSTSNPPQQNQSRMTPESGIAVKTNASSLFGGLSTDWFS